jgi:hypothetical protein
MFTAGINAATSDCGHVHRVRRPDVNQSRGSISRNLPINTPLIGSLDIFTKSYVLCKELRRVEEQKLLLKLFLLRNKGPSIAGGPRFCTPVGLLHEP